MKPNTPENPARQSKADCPTAYRPPVLLNRCGWCGATSAGQPVETQLYNETINVESNLDPAKHAVYEINGDSATPQFLDGEKWLVEVFSESRTARKGKPAIFQDENGCYLKVYNGGSTPFSSVNPDYPDVYAGENLKLVGYPVEKVTTDI